ncbi:MAG TPA: serine/threonine-protein kinase [Candidatus Sulfomarinibacteraceae bacterium]|nr:serine/threonine-protein kinase [Candidatus Sulfomarinibacteraceae bacterium]
MSKPEPGDSRRSRAADDTAGTDDVAARKGGAGGVSAPAVGETLSGRFVLQREIGRGGAGTVYAAFDTRVGQQVAVKVLHGGLDDPNQLERLRREVRASRPGHPNAVAVFDLFEDSGRRFLTMELVAGTSLRDELAGGCRLDLERTIEIGRRIAAALADLHGKGLVHRDVKPGNVLLTPEGLTKLCDLGLVRSTTHGMTITETEMVVGTPAYMAPEQALAVDRTPASDVYALGLTLFQCLSGDVPLQDDTAVATLMLRQRSRPPRVRSVRPDCPGWLDRLLRRMLEPLPADRPTAAEVELALRERRLGRRLRPRPRHVVAASLALLVLASAVVGLRAVSHRPAAAVEVVGSDVVGRDDRGRELWRVAVDQPRLNLSRADLDGDGRDEVLVTGHSEPVDRPLPGEVRHSEIVVLSAAGRVITRVQPEREIGDWSFRYRLEVNPVIAVVDVDGDGVLEVVATCRQRHYFPAVILLYWPRWDVWDQILRHPGSIYEIFPPAPGAVSGIRFIGVNNRLAMSMVVGVIDLVPPPDRTGSATARPGALETPPYSKLMGSRYAGWVDYVPFATQGSMISDGQLRLEDVPGGGFSISVNGGKLHFDRFLNPVDGPNAGRDLRAERVELYNGIYEMKPGFNTQSVDGIERLRDGLARSCGALLTDPTYEVIFVDRVARALARAGTIDGAVEFLQPASERLGNDDLSYLLANLDAIRGELASSGRTLRGLMDRGPTMRARFDAPKLLIRIAAESRNRELVASSVSYVNGRFRADAPLAGVATTLWAGVRLWWDETSEADTRVGSVDYAEDGDAVACLARWRRGASRPGDVEGMRLFIESNPDVAGIGRAALAAALLADGRAGEAIEACDGALAVLEDWSKADFTEHQNLQLVRAIRAVALLAAGDGKLARSEAERLAPELRSDLLPGVLVQEVLAATTS